MEIELTEYLKLNIVGTNDYKIVQLLKRRQRYEYPHSHFWEVVKSELIQDTGINKRMIA